MKTSPSFPVRMYALILKLYPRRFRAEFGEEMQDVFAETCAAGHSGGLRLNILLRELAHLPASLLYAIRWSHVRKGDISMATGPVPQKGSPDSHLVDPIHRPASRPETLAGVGLFLFLGLIFTLKSYWISQPGSGTPMLQGILSLLALLVPLIGFAAGWLQGFPRWWYPYAGHTLLYSLILSLQSVGGTDLNRVLGREVPGWVAWAPLLAVILLLLLVGHPARRLPHLVSGLADLTLLNFAILGAYSWYIYAVLVDMTGLTELPLLLAAYVILAVCGWVVLRSGSVLQRAAVITLGFLMINAIFVWQDLWAGLVNHAPTWNTSLGIWLILSLVTLLPILIMAAIGMIRSLRAPAAP